MIGDDRMSKKSLSKDIITRMRKQPIGTIFTNSDFYDMGNLDAVRKSLSRLCKEKDIVRLIEGYYTIPYFIDVVQEYSYPSADELAEKIAEKYAWRICPYGETALNQVGVSTQVPAVCEYISDGPYREYHYLETTIVFKHTSNRNISKFSKNVALLLQCIKAIGKDKLSDQDIQILASFAKRCIKENLLVATKTVPVWIYNVIKEICEVNNNE